MKRSLLICAAALLIMAPQKPPGEKAKGDKAEFQGTWALLPGSTQNGKPLAEDLVKSLRITFAGDKIILTNGQDSKEGTFTLDPDAKPKAITIKHSDGKTKPSRGIYLIDRGVINLRFADPGKKRPAGFRTDGNTGDFLKLHKTTK
jgi:uncharacterized protein (TIGR03067 family)